MPINAYAKLNAKLTPQERDALYLTPLREHLEGGNLAVVLGGSEKRSKSGEVQHCGINVKMFDVKSAIPEICGCLENCRAPVGSSLDFELDEVGKSYAFGNLEGLGLYLSGTDLPNSNDETCSIKELIDQMAAAMGDRCFILTSSTEQFGSAIYAYGESFAEMQYLIHNVVASSPLCEKSRTIQITPNRGS